MEYDISDSNYIESESNFGFFSIIASIILFVIGVVAILNKKINKNFKIIMGSIIVLLIVLIIVLKICLF